MAIKCLIIDDEPSAQIVLKNFVKDVDFLELSGICNNAIEALEAIQNLNIDLLFLDIKMPKISGLTFYKSLQNPPKVIFTTAYSNYAINGFEVNAVDFLMKPFSFERFLIAVNKAFEKNHIEHPTSIDPQSILLKSNKTIHKVLLKDILFIEAYGDYVKVHIKNKLIITNKTFRSILKLLSPSKFIQVHKSFAIYIEAMDSISGNQIKIDKHTIPIGQKYKSDFLNFLDKKY